MIYFLLCVFFLLFNDEHIVIEQNALCSLRKYIYIYKLKTPESQTRRTGQTPNNKW